MALLSSRGLRVIKFCRGRQSLGDVREIFGVECERTKPMQDLIELSPRTRLVSSSRSRSMVPRSVMP
jgi:hypothetical protein